MNSLLAVACPFSPMDSSTDGGSLSDSLSPLPPQTPNEHRRMDLYERRVQGLERLRRRVSAYQQEERPESMQYGQLQANLLELMENDVNLMRQLMALGERIEELKSITLASSVSNSSVSGSSSMISLDGVCCDEQEQDNDGSRYDKAMANNTSSEAGATSIDVPGDKCDEEDQYEDECNVEIGGSNFAPKNACASVRIYFSRQNSILRIPIPPSRGLRSKTMADAQHCSTEVTVRRGRSSACDTSSSDDTNSCGSYNSDTRRGAGWYARKRACRSAVTTQGSLPTRKQADGAGTVVPRHASQGSCDSGVHHLNNSPDFLDGEDLIYV